MKLVGKLFLDGYFKSTHVIAWLFPPDKRLWWWWHGGTMTGTTNKPRIRNFPRISNKESETKTRESETKIRESETKIPRIRNQKPRESETKIQESDTKPCESETENQKLKIANQTPRSANQKPNKPTNQKPKKANQTPNLPPPLNILLNEILPPTYPHKGSNPPPPLNTMLKRILHLFIFSSWGIKSATPSRHYVEWDIAFNISPYWTKSANPSDHYAEWDILHKTSNPPPRLAIMLNEYYLQRIHIWDQIRHPLWPFCWMRYYLQSILIRDLIKSGTPSDNYVEWDITFKYHHTGPNPPAPLTIILN